MFKGMFGRGAQDLREMPDYIAEVDHIVCIAPPDMRVILIKFYGTGGTITDKALSLGLDRRTMMRRVDRADYFVHSILDAVPEKVSDSRQNAPTYQKARILPQDRSLLRSPAHG